MRGDHVGVMLPRRRLAASTRPAAEADLYWTIDPGTLLRRLRSSAAAGLTTATTRDSIGHCIPAIMAFP